MQDTFGRQSGSAIRNTVFKLGGLICQNQDAGDKERPALVPAASGTAGGCGCEVGIGTVCKQRDK